MAAISTLPPSLSSEAVSSFNPGVSMACPNKTEFGGRVLEAGKKHALAAVITDLMTQSLICKIKFGELNEIIHQSALSGV